MTEFKVATLVGCAIGDALGNPFEMKSANSTLLKEWDGLFKAGGTFWKGDPGQYTDDTLMSIALSKSLLQCNGYDPEDVAKEYLYWYNTGNTRGIGNTTAEAMYNLKTGANWQNSGLLSLKNAGNGTAMRAAPLGLFYRNNSHECIKNAFLDASITHNSDEPKYGSTAVALGVSFAACRNYDPYEVNPPLQILGGVARSVLDSDVKTKLILAQFNINNNVSPEIALAHIGTSGYVADTVGAAFYCFAKAASFKETVTMAVRGGGDTDTIAAIAGALAGTYYGLNGIPNEYKYNVENFELLHSLDQELMNSNV